MIPESKTGFCRVRSNVNGRLETPYGNISSAHADPIEKKPLFHFHPSTYVYSIGSWGCNLTCKNCQNYQISQRPVVNSEVTTAKDICKRAKINKCHGIAFTYNEPTTWYEFMEDTAVEAKKNGLYTVCVTNGFVQKEPFKELTEYIDAFNIDVKSFSERFYSQICQGSLKPVLDNVKTAVEQNVHVELTYLIIPGYNDNVTEIQDFSYWVSEVDNSIPVHFTAFHPDYKLKESAPTPIDSLLKARYIAQLKGLKYVYIGNTRYPGAEDTVCPKCGGIAIKRTLFNTEKTNGHCPYCNEELNVTIEEC